MSIWCILGLSAAIKFIDYEEAIVFTLILQVAGLLYTAQLRLARLLLPEIGVRQSLVGLVEVNLLQRLSARCLIIVFCGAGGVI